MSAFAFAWQTPLETASARPQRYSSPAFIHWFYGNSTRSYGMTDAEIAQLEKWQTTDGGKAELAINALGYVADDLTDALKTRDGARAIRLGWPHICEAIKKLDDLAFEIDSTWRQAAE